MDGTERVLVVAPHPDDEVLGAGGTIAAFAAAGADVRVVIVTKAGPPRFPAALGEAGIREAKEAHALLGVKETVTLDLPIAELDVVPHAEVNARLGEVFARTEPTHVFLPFGGDLMEDHQRVSLSALVCSRPLGEAAPLGVYAYETLSQTNWNAPYAPRFAPPPSWTSPRTWSARSRRWRGSSPSCAPSPRALPEGDPGARRPARGPARLRRRRGVRDDPSAAGVRRR
uniref:LmbE family protein n=1 Tax=Streptomyces sp. MMG1612 TaxID=1415547 RepID=U5YR95_9ACTN|nr:hypothetical protein [Streptomyces sp. MMG1612]